MLWILLGTTAFAHKPFYGGDWTSPESAFYIEDPEISIVLYEEITCDAEQLWLTFDAVADDRIWVQLGVPEIERLEDYRPQMAVLAPGLPALEDVPFEVPEGMGGIEIRVKDEPVSFYEPFTGTSSWIYSERYVKTPVDGTGYIVAWHPERQTGKLWVAVGTVEDFSDVDFEEASEWGPVVNGFHETGRYEDVPDVEETVCGLDDVAPAATPDDTAAEATGCTTAASSPSGWLTLLGLLALGRR